MTTFVLVHGSFGGGWVWKNVVSLLRAEGHEVYTPRLTGLSDRSHLLECGVDLVTHITDVASLLFYEDLSDVVLVGHSYAGMVITGVAAKIPERIKLLVYLDAYVPSEGKNEFDLWPTEERVAAQVDMLAGKGLRQPPPPAILGITDPVMVNWAYARFTPHPLTTYAQPVPTGNEMSAAIPRVFIRCTTGLWISRFAPFAEKARTDGWKVYELATGHMAMLTAPREVAELLINLPGVSA